MVEYDSAAVYIEGAVSLRDKISRINEVIDALIKAATAAAANDGISEYALDNGQTKIKTVYRGTAAIFNSIKDFERLKQIYVNRLNGHVTRLVDSKNFRR